MVHFGQNDNLNIQIIIQDANSALIILARKEKHIYKAKISAKLDYKSVICSKGPFLCILK